MDIHLWIFIFYGYQLRNVLAWIYFLGYQCGYQCLYGYLKTNMQKSWISMLISVEFLEIHAWICYGFSDQGRQTLACN